MDSKRAPGVDGVCRKRSGQSRNPRLRAPLQAAIHGEPHHAPSRFDEDIAVGEQAFAPRNGDIIHPLAQEEREPFIQEELVLAENTVKTHIAHIYAKLGIGNRQEMTGSPVLGATEEDVARQAPRLT